MKQLRAMRNKNATNNQLWATEQMQVKLENGHYCGRFARCAKYWRYHNIDQMDADNNEKTRGTIAASANEKCAGNIFRIGKHNLNLNFL